MVRSSPLFFSNERQKRVSIAFLGDQPKGTKNTTGLIVGVAFCWMEWLDMDSFELERDFEKIFEGFKEIVKKFA